MQYTHIVGIDVSKATIDASLSANQANASILNRQFSNSLKDHEKFLAWVERAGIKIQQVLICLENTGLYHCNLVDFFQSKKASV